MKVIFVFILVVASSYAALSAEFKDRAKDYLKEIVDQCSEQEHANADDIAEIVKRQLPSRKEGKCMMACFNERFGAQAADGTPNLSNAIEAISIIEEADAELYGKMKNIFETCFPQVVHAGDRCETALQIGACVWKMRVEVGIPEDCIM